MSTSQECNYINCYLFDLGFNPELKVVLKYNAILLPQYPLLNRTYDVSIHYFTVKSRHNVTYFCLELPSYDLFLMN